MRARKVKAVDGLEPSAWQQNRVTRQQRLLRSMLAPASQALVRARPDDARWFCLVVKDGCELPVSKHLEDGGVEVLVPTETVERKTAKGLRYDAERALYAGYAFVRLVPSSEAFDRLRKVKSVLDFLRFGERYHEVREADLAFYLCDVDRLPKDKTICDGTKVAIRFGPFSGLKAVVLQVVKPQSSNPYCRVWLDVYQREIKNLPLAFVEKL